jgi:hypothetical protein
MATSPAVAAHWFQVQAKYICSPNHYADVESLPMARAKKVCWISIKIGIFRRDPNPKKACIDSEPWKSWEYQQHSEKCQSSQHQVMELENVHLNC